MQLRSGLMYEDHPLFLNNKDMLEIMGINAKYVDEVDLIFVNEFCVYISEIKKLQNQHDKTKCILKIFKLIYNNRDGIDRMYHFNSNFITFIIMIYEKSRSLMNKLIDSTLEDHVDKEDTLLGIYYLYNTQKYLEREYNL